MVDVLVVAGASRDEIVGAHGNALRVRTTAPAEGGKANARVAELLAAAVEAPVRLLGGAASRRKRMLIVGVSPQHVRSRLGL